MAKANWEKLGVDVAYTEYEWNVFIQQYVMALKFDVCVLGWSGGTDYDSRQLWHSTCWPTQGGLNLAAYSNAEADKLMDGILKVYDYKQQVEMSHKIFRTIASEFPYVFLYSPLATTVMDNRIVWRKKVGTDASGNSIFENRPVNHDYIRTARASLVYFSASSNASRKLRSGRIRTSLAYILRRISDGSDTLDCQRAELPDRRAFARRPAGQPARSQQRRPPTSNRRRDEIGYDDPLCQNTSISTASSLPTLVPLWSSSLGVQTNRGN